MDLSKIPEARKAGYSDTEIADFLAASNPKIKAARDAGYRDSEIIAHLAPKRSFGEKAVDFISDTADTVTGAVKKADHYFDTQVSKGLGGVAGMPRAAADAMEWVTQKTGMPMAGFGPLGAVGVVGKQMPTGDELSKWLIQNRQRNEPDYKETNLNPIIDAGVQGMVGGPLVGSLGKGSAALNFLAGAGFEAAGEEFKGTPWEPFARIAGAATGAGGAVAGRAAAGKALEAGKEMIGAFTPGGRDKIVGTALNRQAANPNEAVTALDSYVAGRDAFPDSVPGFRLDAGKASRDPGLMAAVEVAEAKTPAMKAQYQSNNTKLHDAIDRASAGLPPAEMAGETIQKTLRQRFEDLVKQRREATDPLYQSARQSPTPVQPWPLMTFTADAVAANKGEPAQVMSKARELLFTTDKNGRVIADRSSRGLMATRDALNDMLSNTELGNHSRSLLMEMKSKVDDALNAVPQAKVANAKFAEMSKPLDPFNEKLGNKVVADVIEKDQFNKGLLMPAEKVPSQFMKGGDLSAPTIQKLMMASGGDTAVKQAMQSAYLSDFRKAAASAVAEDPKGGKMLTASGASKWLEKHSGGAANVLTPDQMAALRDITKHLTDQAQTVPGRTGSPTFDRLATESIVGALISPKYADAPFLHPVRKTLGLVYGGANEAAMTRLVEALSDPAVASALMKKATPGNVKMASPVLERIAKGSTAPTIRQDERGSP